MLKRVGAVVLTVVMLLSMACTFCVASAAGQVALEVTANKTNVNRGGEVEFTVKLQNGNVELTGLIIKLSEVDPRLTLKGEPVFSSNFAPAASEGNAHGWASAGALQIPADKVIAKFIFTVDGDAVDGAAKVVVAGEATDNGAVIGDVTVASGSGQVVIACKHDVTGAAFVAPSSVTNMATAQHYQVCKLCQEKVYNKCTFKYKTTVNHTNDKAGAKVYACQDCKAEYRELIPAGHKTVLIYAAATATKDGKWKEHCSVCNQDVTTTAITQGHPGKDVTKTSLYYYNYTQYAKATGLMVGDTAGKFNPNKDIKRGEFASIVARIYYGSADKIPTFKNAQLTLTDLKGKWYRHAAQAMYNEGIIAGVKQKNGTYKFNGDAPITREAVVSLFHRLYTKMYKDASIKFAAAGSVVDMNKVSSWAKKDVQWSLDTGLVVGDATTKKFNPKNNIKRRDMAVILTKYDVATRKVKIESPSALAKALGQ